MSTCQLAGKLASAARQALDEPVREHQKVQREVVDVEPFVIELLDAPLIGTPRRGVTRLRARARARARSRVRFRDTPSRYLRPLPEVRCVNAATAPLRVAEGTLDGPLGADEAPTWLWAAVSKRSEGPVEAKRRGLRRREAQDAAVGAVFAGCGADRGANGPIPWPKDRPAARRESFLWLWDLLL
jgi:hypothetical protein